MNSSLERLTESSSNPKLLAKRFSRERRHTIQIPCNSYVKDVPTGNSSKPLVIIRRPDSAKTLSFSDVEARDACVLPKWEKDHPTSRPEKCSLWTLERTTSERYPQVCWQRNVASFPEILSVKKPVCGGHTLSAITEIDVSDVLSVSTRRSRQQKHLLPQITSLEHNNSLQNSTRSAVSKDTSFKPDFRTPNKLERSQAFEEHLQKAEARYQNGKEMKALRLFEWLKDQTDTHEIKLTR